MNDIFISVNNQVAAALLQGGCSSVCAAAGY